MSNYDKQYLEKQWLCRRLMIMARDRFMCAACRSTSNLQVHHKVYCSKLKVWEYEDKRLETLCQSCHQSIHDHVKITSMPRLKKYVIPTEVYDAYLSLSNSKFIDFITGYYSDTVKRIEIATISSEIQALCIKHKKIGFGRDPFLSSLNELLKGLGYVATKKQS